MPLGQGPLGLQWQVLDLQGLLVLLLLQALQEPRQVWQRLGQALRPREPRLRQQAPRAQLAWLLVLRVVWLQVRQVPRGQVRLVQWW